MGKKVHFNDNIETRYFNKNFPPISVTNNNKMVETGVVNNGNKIMNSKMMNSKNKVASSKTNYLLWIFLFLVTVIIFYLIYLFFARKKKEK